VAAEQHEAQVLVADRRLVDDHLWLLLPLCRELMCGGRETAARAGGTAKSIDRPVAGDPVEPGRRIVGDAMRRPVGHRGDESVLHGLVGKVEVAETSGEEGEHAPTLLTRQAGNRLVNLSR